MNNIFPEKYNFICIILGDNDFAKDLYDGMAYLKEHSNFENLCPFTVKSFIKEYLIQQIKLKHILNGVYFDKQLEIFYNNYFQNIIVLFNKKFPTIDLEGLVPYDADGGAVCANVNTGFISLF